MSILEKITAERREAVPLPSFFAGKDIQPNKKSFKDALERRRAPALIAEIKRRSPSKGELQPDLDIHRVIEQYRPFASAVSVLTEPAYFGGSLDDLKTAAAALEQPVLRKDFLTHPLQIKEARYFGASACLVIVSVLSQSETAELISACREYKMDALVEVHTVEEARIAIEAGADILGINNRNLHDLSIDPAITSQIVEAIGSDADRLKIVSESGIYSADDIRSLPSQVDAVLVGTSLMLSERRDALLSELSGR